MTRVGQFRQLIDRTLRRSGGHRVRQLAALRREFEQLDPDGIAQFERTYRAVLHRAYTWDLWAAAYILGGGCSDDGFEYFRAWLISRGRRVYEASLRDPDSLARIVRRVGPDLCQHELFSYVAQGVWAKKTGMDAFDLRSRIRLRLPRRPAGREWAEERGDLARRLPELWRRFGW